MAQTPTSSLTSCLEQRATAAERGLTPHSSRTPTASRQARSVARYILHSPGLAPSRWCRLSSNVRRHSMLARTLLVLLCAPLTAFYCATMSRMYIRSTQAPEVTTTEFVVQQFDSAAIAVRGWASENGFKEAPCNREIATPFCKTFISKRSTVELRLEPYNNQIELILLDNFGQSGSPEEKSLRSALAKSGNWILVTSGPK